MASLSALLPRVIFVVFDGLQTLDLTGPAEVFAAVERRGGRPYANVVASTGGCPVTSSSGCVLATERLANVRPRPSDTVLVVGGEEPAIRSAIADVRLGDWLRRAARVVRRIGSVCSGTFVLADAGFLDGLTAATHWSACERLSRLHPTVRVDRDAIFVRQGKVWTSAGVTTGIDMALAMVEEDHGRALADAIAAHLVLYARRPGFQSQFSDALVAQTSASDPLGPVIAWAKTHLDELDVETLARRARMSVRTFHRRCHAVLGMTPAELADKLRVEHARTLLTTSDRSAKELAAACGFRSTARMNRAFDRVLGLSPRSYRTLFGPAAA